MQSEKGQEQLLLGTSVGEQLKQLKDENFWLREYAEALEQVLRIRRVKEGVSLN